MHTNIYNNQITQYYSDNTPINIIITNIINENDNFIVEIYGRSLEYEKINKNIKILADILVIQYCSIRCIYDMPSLCNNNYRNTRPTTYSIFGEDKTLLASLIIQIDCTNALLHFLNDNYPNKVSKTNLVIDKVLNLDNDIDIISNSPMDNIDIYKKKTLDLFSDLWVFLNE
jgi:hypothetical protein